MQLCKLIGAEIFVTVGSDEKRQYISQEFQIPPDHVFNSRNLDFVEPIKALGGIVKILSSIWKINLHTGVDIVLNSLSGEFLLQSVGLLKPFGKFVEIGKRDIVMNKPLGTSVVLNSDILTFYFRIEVF